MVSTRRLKPMAGELATRSTAAVMATSDATMLATLVTFESACASSWFSAARICGRGGMPMSRTNASAAGSLRWRSASLTTSNTLMQHSAETDCRLFGHGPPG